MTEFAVPWTKALDLSAHYFNEDHHALLDKLNALLNALSLQDRMSVIFAANALSAEAQGHFAKEEQCMRDVNYPELEKHAEAHQRLLQGLEELRYKVNMTENFSAMLDASPFLERWFVPHLSHDDQKLSEFLLARGSADTG